MTTSLNHYIKKREQLLSKKYFKYVELHKTAHSDGIVIKDNIEKKETAFLGNSLVPHVKFINDLLNKYSCQSLLDYGCGKAMLYDSVNELVIDKTKYTNLREYWNSINIYLYDPCYQKFSSFPKKKSDITISTDVLEHIPEEDLHIIVKELFMLTNKVLFISVPTYLSNEYFINKLNSHPTVQNQKWWSEKIKNIHKSFDSVDWYLVYRFNSKTGRQNRIISNTQANI